MTIELVEKKCIVILNIFETHIFFSLVFQACIFIRVFTNASNVISFHVNIVNALNVPENLTN